MIEQMAPAVLIVLLTVALVSAAVLFYVEHRHAVRSEALFQAEWNQIMKELDDFLKQEEMKR